MALIHITVIHRYMYGEIKDLNIYIAMLLVRWSIWLLRIVKAKWSMFQGKL